MNMMNWSPFREFDRIFPRYGVFGDEPAGPVQWSPPADISETDDAYLIELDLPSVPRDAINVTVKDGVLTVSGERKPASDGDARRHRVERRYGEFFRSFRLPEDVDGDGIAASFKDGSLSLSVRKRQEVLPRTISVDVH